MKVRRNKMKKRILINLCSLPITYVILMVQAFAQAGDPLPSWNNGVTKKAIIDFVEEVTDKTSPDFVAPADRVATFDNDGTLYAEKPVACQFSFVSKRINEMAKDHPEWKTKQPFKTILEKDSANLQKMNIQDLMNLIITTHSGVTESEFAAEVAEFLSTTQNPKFKRLFTELIYQPQLELLNYLRANGFNVFICSGDGIDFMRVFSDKVYGVPKENVIGSSLKYKYNEGTNTVETVPEINSIVDNAGKSENIQLHIGKRPILACGNSDGDIQMLEFADDNIGPALLILIHHDDADREFAYDTGTEKALKAARERDWTVVSIKNDFKVVFPFEKK